MATPDSQGPGDAAAAGEIIQNRQTKRGIQEAPVADDGFYCWGFLGIPAPSPSRRISARTWRLRLRALGAGPGGEKCGGGDPPPMPELSMNRSRGGLFGLPPPPPAPALDRLNELQGEGLSGL